MGAPVLPLWRQEAFAFYEDGTEAGSTLIGTIDTNPTLDSDTIYQCRFLLQEYNGENKDVSLLMKVQYNLNSAGWVDMSLTTPVQYTNSANLTDGGATTQRIGAGSFVAGRVYETEDLVNPIWVTAGNDESEALLSIKIDKAQVSDTDIIQLQILEADGTLLDTYTSTPSITVNVVTVPQSILIGRVTETSTANPLSASKVKAIGRVTETSTAFSLSSSKVKAIGRVIETGIAKSLSSNLFPPQKIYLPLQVNRYPKQQPTGLSKIDWNHPNSRGLIYATVDGADLISGTMRRVDHTLAKGTRWIEGHEATDVDPWDTNPILGVDEYTIVLRARLPIVSTNTNSLFFIGHYTSTVDQSGIWISFDAESKVSVGFRSNTGLVAATLATVHTSGSIITVQARIRSSLNELAIYSGGAGATLSTSPDKQSILPSPYIRVGRKEVGRTVQVEYVYIYKTREQGLDNYYNSAKHIFDDPYGHIVPVQDTVHYSSPQEPLPPLSVLIGRVIESSSAQPLTHFRSLPIGKVTETSSARTLLHFRSLAIGKVTETSTAQTLSHSKLLAIGRVIESSISMALLHSRALPIGKVTESSFARPFVIAADKTPLILDTKLLHPEYLYHSRLPAFPSKINKLHKDYNHNLVFYFVNGKDLVQGLKFSRITNYAKGSVYSRTGSTRCSNEKLIGNVIRLCLRAHIVQVDTTPGLEIIFLWGHYISGTNRSGIVVGRDAQTGQIWVGQYNDGTPVLYAKSPSSYAVGDVINLRVYYNPNGTVAVNINGVPFEVSGNPRKDIFDPIVQLGTPSATYPNEVEFAAVYATTHNLRNIKSIQANPYDMCMPIQDNQLLPINPSVVEELVLILQSIVHTLTLDNIDLVQQNTLIVQEALHTLTLEEPAITQQSTLVVEDSVLAILLDLVTLTAHATIVVEDTLKTTTSGNIDLVQQAILVVESELHSKTSTTDIDLLQSGILTLEGILHSLTLGELELLQASILTLEGTFKSLTSGEVTLSGSALLELEESLHTITLELVAFTQQNTLQVDESLLTISLETLALIQAGLLVLEGSLHAKSSDNIDFIQGGALELEDNALQMTSNSVNLVQSATIIVEGNLLTISSDVVTLLQANILSLDSLLLTITSDNIDVTTGTSIELEDLLLSTTSDSIDLLQASTLSIDRSTLAILLGTIDLTVAIDIVVDNVIHTITVDSVDLTSQTFIVVQDTVKELTSENVELSTQLNLDVDGSLLSRLVDNITLLQGHVVTLFDCTHTKSTEAVTLVQGNQLDVDKSTLAILLEEVILTNKPTLAIQHSLHGYTIDSVNLVQQGIIVVDSLLHAYLADHIELFVGIIELPSLEGMVYMLGAGAPIYSTNGDTPIYVLKDSTELFILK